MRDTEKRVLEAIDVDGLVDYLCEIISVPSAGGQETAAQRHVLAKMKEIGLEVDAWDVDFDLLRRHPAFSMTVDRKEGMGVAGSLGKQNKGRSLILNGHIDVVFPGDEAKWHYLPWKGTVTRGRVYGRGAADMKGGLCCALFAAKAIVDADIRLKGRLIVESVIAEEDGGAGALDTLLRGYRADAAIIVEPSELDAVPAHAGVAAYRIKILGKAAHASIREDGVSAIEKFIPIYEALRKLEAERNNRLKNPLYTRYTLPYPISVGRIEGGMWPGTVAESLFFDGRIGVAVGEETDHAMRELEEAVRNAAESDPWLKQNPPMVEWRWYRSEPSSIPVDHPIVETVKMAYREVAGTTPRVEGKTFSSDMRLFIKVGGIPTMIFGPGDIRQAHAADEFVTLADLEKATKTLALTILRYCAC